jgi:hypothetical protein
MAEPLLHTEELEVHTESELELQPSDKMIGASQ